MLGQGGDTERAVWLLQNWYSSIINTHKGQALNAHLLHCNLRSASVNIFGTQILRTKIQET